MLQIIPIYNYFLFAYILNFIHFLYPTVVKYDLIFTVNYFLRFYITFVY